MSDSLSLFDLDEAALGPIVAALAGGPIARFSLVALTPVSRGVSGGDKWFATFHYETPTGESGEATLFAKRCVWKNRPESVHYRYLSAQTPPVPTPRLFGSVRTEDGTEVVFLERIETGEFRRDAEADWRELLSLMARFNACPLSEEYAVHLHPFEQVGRVSDHHWITGLTAFPTAEEIDHYLQNLGDLVPTSERAALTDAALRLFAQVEAQPRGLLHQDFLPDNWGRRRSGELVVFDLHKNACGPRFADVAPYFGLPDAFGANAAFGEALGEPLAQHYLSEYARFGGGIVSLATFQEEIATLSWAHRVSVLPWQTNMDARDSVRETLAYLRSQI